MISLPIGLWTIGDNVLPWAISLNVLILTAAGIYLLLASAGTARALRAIGVVLAGGWFVEFTGSTFGIPFGHYDYTPVLQPQLGGVPILIPLAWLMMLPSAWAVAQQLQPNSRLGQIVVSGLAFTAWDLFLDPQMVAWNFWVWDNPSGYFGIPWVNFLGWFVSAAALTWLANPPRLPAPPLLLIYTLTWALQTIGLAFFWNMPGPALCGFLAMGVFVAAAWMRWRRSAHVGV
jgi:putative membrane protein